MKAINVLSLSEMCEAALDGEPVFIIRAQDVCALQTIVDYLEHSKKAQGTNLSRVSKIIQRFTEWQKSNPLKLKAPD